MISICKRHCLWILCLLSWHALAADTRYLWNYDIGFFSQTEGTAWNEVINGHIAFHFVELARNDNEVVLYDSSRDIYVDLKEDQMLLRTGDRGPYTFFKSGAWSRRPYSLFKLKGVTPGQIPLTRTKPLPPPTNALEDRVLDLINGERQRRQLPELVWNRYLATAAQGHAYQMSVQRNESHELNGKGYEERIDASGGTFRIKGESIFSGSTPQNTPSSALWFWVNTTPNRKNIQNENFTQAGVGVSTDSNGFTYFCIDFGG